MCSAKSAVVGDGSSLDVDLVLNGAVHVTDAYEAARQALRPEKYVVVFTGDDDRVAGEFTQPLRHLGKCIVNDLAFLRCGCVRVGPDQVAYGRRNAPTRLAMTRSYA